MITSSSNEQIKNIRELLKKKKARDEQGFFVVEGLKMCMELPAERREAVFVSESFMKEPERAALAEALGAQMVADRLFDSVSDTRTPQGILAVAGKCEADPEEMYSRAMSGRPLVILEGLQDPGNLGTILRAGEGAGIAGVLMDRYTVDIYNPKVVRATMGSLFRVPFAIVDDLPGLVKGLRERGIRVFAAELGATLDYTRAELAAPSAFLIGNEGNGLSREIISLADESILIPMEGSVESLNAALAASLLMYEAFRQRRSK